MNRRMRKTLATLLDELWEVLDDGDAEALEAAQDLIEEIQSILEENEMNLNNYPETFMESERV